MLDGEEMAQKLGPQSWDLWLGSEHGCGRLRLVGNNQSVLRKHPSAPWAQRAAKQAPRQTTA